MGGLGSRFAKNGYALPKPLVNIMGRPMISWLIGNLTFQQGDILHIALQAQLDADYNVCELIRREFPLLDIRFTKLDGLTRGAAETLYKVTEPMTQAEQTRPTISLDCDTFYFSDVIQAFRDLEPNQGCCCYFEDKGDAPIFSYIDMKAESNKRITNIAEKVAISRNANTGAYGFPNAIVLNQYVVKLLAKPLPSVGEFYTSALISSMIEDSVDFRGIHIADFECVGTPTQLLEFFKTAVNRLDVIEPRVVALDVNSVPVLQDAGQVSDEHLQHNIGEEVFRLVDEAAKVAVQIKFSLASGFISEGKSKSKYSFMSRAEREDASSKGMLLPIDDNLQKAVGWYF